MYNQMLWFKWDMIQSILPIMTTLYNWSCVISAFAMHSHPWLDVYSAWDKNVYFLWLCIPFVFHWSIVLALALHAFIYWILIHVVTDFIYNNSDNFMQYNGNPCIILIFLVSSPKWCGLGLGYMKFPKFII